MFKWIGELILKICIFTIILTVWNVNVHSVGFINFMIGVLTISVGLPLVEYMFRNED